MKRSLQREKAYRHLRSMLLHGGLRPGMRLGETEWAERLGVHRGALREAFVLLAHEGLLMPGARGGYFVPILEQADLDEVLELRLALERGALRRLARAGEPVGTKALRATCQVMRQMVELDMPVGHAEADRKFHEGLVELADNRRMIRAYHQAPLLIIASEYMTPAERRGAMTQTLRDHERICDLLEAGRFDAVAELLEQHLKSNPSALATLNQTMTK
ncbi:GntR family transcriptional regulator [Phycisphaerales bacterium AB-hyl4]|uniref:GntR family transcriptional regulator n=1 Tax=Natronomicrosphaera hydrolytica TaxID=3242702 RepID=A0ABV4U5K1_9BACT